MQLQVTNSPFDQDQIELLNRLLPNLTDAQQVWLSGYLSAVQSSVGMTQATITSAATVTHPETKVNGEAAVNKEVTVLYGSQTGNGQALAEDFTSQLEAQGFQVSLVSMNDFKANTIKQQHQLLIIVSTHGEGDPPDNALLFYEYLKSRRAPRLEGIRYSVLSLGDSSYDQFCQTGKEFDERLNELGAERICERVDCDLDYDEPAAEWFTNVMNRLQELQQVSVVSNQSVATVEVKKVDQPSYSRTNPYQAEIYENINLNGRGSNKETRHLELSIAESQFQFEPGDSLGIYPENEPSLVDELISELQWDPEEQIVVNKQGDQWSIRNALLHHYEITVLTKPLLVKATTISDHKKLHSLLMKENDKQLKEFLYGRDLLDFVREFSFAGVSAQEFLPILRKMPPRLYSIASSLHANPDEVHLTIGTVRYHSHGRLRNGVCSVQCAERMKPGDTLPVYVHRNPNFKLPKDPDTPIIMVGPGTGIAPFRSFLEEREELNMQGKSWLFFGDQHYRTDFLYQIEWQRWLKNGVLTKMDVAFSRDTDKKVYVQHRMLESSQSIFRWLEDGAVIYICGDEKNMAKDVHNTLTHILEREGKMSQEEATTYLLEMQRNGRYQRDVY